MSHWPPAPPRWLRLAFLATRNGTLTVVVLLGLSSLTAAGLDQGGPSSTLSRRPAVVQHMIDRHQCSTTGFESNLPASAIVRSDDGHLRLVSFERGWQLFTQHGAASLVAVCLDDPPRPVTQRG